MFDTPSNTWITKPPVYETTDWPDIQLICNQFSAEAETFARPATDSEVVWEHRKRWAVIGANQVAKLADNEEQRGKYKFCVYKPGKVVGLMIWKPRETMGEVLYLAMLPGHESEGALLVEFAVTLSELAGYRGHVYFPAFIPGKWQYRPSWLQYLQYPEVLPHYEPDHWAKIDGEWRLLKLLLPVHLNLQQAPVRLSQREIGARDKRW